MKVAEAIQRIESILIPYEAAPVFRSVADELSRAAGAHVDIARSMEDVEHPGVFCIAPAADFTPPCNATPAASFRLSRHGSGLVTANPPCLLFGFVTWLLRHFVHADIKRVARTTAFPAAFAWQRSVYDYFLTQEGRIQRGLNTKTYIRRLAQAGFTHLEVNGLAFPMALEMGPKGEAYPMFYTYCPALDQFVSSQLNRDLYPDYYLSANLATLKSHAALARRYGLAPGLLCFEPRSVPEEFFARYPMLRGARVDHPFRSFRPRYNMTIAHPKVREHYAEMMKRLMQEVPELGFLSIWSNDSGAGFEHTSSLYVGRNGGAYLIREWRGHTDIARAAAENALRFLRVLRDAAREVNPEFRVVTRLEPFAVERDIIWEGLRDGVDVETASLIARGWEMPYTHPRYEESHSINIGSIHQSGYDDREAALAKELEERGSRAHQYVAFGPHAIFAPLLAIPYPTLTARRLRTLHDGGVRALAHLGGTCPPELVPFNVNHQVLLAFQFDPQMDVDETVRRIATHWATERFAGALLRAWALAEETILAFPNVTPLYSTMGFIWYRLWARPLVPNIEAISPDDRAYYERFMCTTPHNPNNVDLSRDVLFQLTTAEGCRRTLARIDGNVWRPMDDAIAGLEEIRGEAEAALGEGGVIEDQVVRLSALRCWFMTQRNVAAWVAAVHGWLGAETDTEKQQHRALLRDAVTREIINSRDLLALLDSSVEFMSLTDQGETPLVYGDNLKQLLPRRMALMEAHLDDEPYIDPDYIERQSGMLLA